MQLKAEYDERGFVSVPSLFTPEEAALFKNRAIDILEREGKLEVPSGVNVWMADEIASALREFVTDERLVRVVQALIGDRPEFLSVKTVYKDAGKRFPSPWHQDWFYWEGSPKLSAWIALDDATETNGCLRLIPGTHRQVFPMESTVDGPGFNKQISEDSLRGFVPETVPAAVGDVVFFHDLAVHASHPNTDGVDRWSLIATYRDSTVVDSSTTWKSSLPLGST